jgi:hypothetical protein
VLSPQRSVPRREEIGITNIDRSRTADSTPLLYQVWPYDQTFAGCLPPLFIPMSDQVGEGSKRMLQAISQSHWSPLPSQGAILLPVYSYELQSTSQLRVLFEEVSTSVERSRPGVQDEKAMITLPKLTFQKSSLQSVEVGYL